MPENTFCKDIVSKNMDKLVEFIQAKKTFSEICHGLSLCNPKADNEGILFIIGLT